MFNMAGFTGLKEQCKDKDETGLSVVVVQMQRKLRVDL